MKGHALQASHTGQRADQPLSLPHRDYASWNLSVNLYTVNAPWLFSLLWCAGVPSVTSDNSHTLSQVPSPLWIMVSWGLLGVQGAAYGFQGWGAGSTPGLPLVRSQGWGEHLRGQA